MSKNADQKDRRFQQNDCMWIYGKHAVKAALSNSQRRILRFILLESNKDLLDEISSEVLPEFANKDVFLSLFGRDTIHQGCAVLVKKLPQVFLEDLLQDNYDDRPFIFLDQVTDPQNIGSVLRAAAVFGARAIVVTKDHSPELTPAIAKAASGALEVVPIVRVTNFAQSIKILKQKEFWLVGLDERSDKKLHEVNLRGKFAFIIGSEGFGMRRLSREACDFVVQLPGPSTFTTLNAAQAATVTLYESYQQRTAF